MGFDSSTLDMVLMGEVVKAGECLAGHDVTGVNEQTAIMFADLVAAKGLHEDG